MTDAKTKAAQALDPLLSAFRVLDDQVLRAVWYRQECDILDRVVLQFEELSLVISAVESDEIDFEAIHLPKIDDLNYVDASVLSPWHEMIGKSLAGDGLQ
jgi:hypothetical protein